MVFPQVKHCSITPGKTTVATALSKFYDIPILKIDDVIIASLSSGTASGTMARDLCAEAARRIADEGRGADELLQRGLPGLSTEALTAHTQGTRGLR